VTAAVLKAALPALLFLAFLVLVLRVRPGDGPSRGTVRALVAFTAIVSAAAGLTARDLWPFAAWRFIPYQIGSSGLLTREVVVDAQGRESPLDYCALEPLEPGEFAGYVRQAPPFRRQEAVDFMRDRAQAAAADVRAGRPCGRFHRLLGVLSAPTFQSVPRRWTSAADVPWPIVAVRIYDIPWRVTGDGIETGTPRLIVASRP
jgi:hypothetical protein